jgi:predicted ATPase/DNA-binding SARP family transcriptional activator
MGKSIRLSLLGLPRLELDGAPLEFKRRKALNLLAYLCLHPAEHPRERLAALFWGDSDDEAARLSLRVTISDLRKGLGEEAFIGGRDSLGLSPTLSVWVDALEFEKLAKGKSAPDWQEALGLYADEFLPDVYEDWALEWRERLAQLHVETLLRLTAHHRSSADYDKAIELARRLLALDPANEAAHQHIMVCYEALGDRAAALRQYESCIEALQGLVGVRPSSMTEAIYQRLQKAASGISAKLTAHPTNLPAPLTSFVGREAELEAVESLLAPLAREAQPARLVTLIGPGGSGKTRLSIQAASELVDTYEQGVWWVELAALTRPEDVLAQVAVVFGLKEQPGASLEEALLDALKNRHFLLVLDNCEHLLDACTRLAALILQNCPRAQILATSREAFSIGGEQIYPVPPLELPENDPIDPEAAAQIEALRLFVERARAVLPSFELDNANLAAVTAICRRLDGIPLAIELAASRLKALSPAQIAERLDDRFRLLASGDRAALPRQQTLYALIDWSYGLLDEDEKALFRRLAILPGGCTLEAAEALGADLAALPLDLLTRLVEKSLLVARETQTGMRYRMLDSIRHFGLHRLAEAGEADLAPARALNYFAMLVDGIEPDLSERMHVDANLSTLTAEQDNLRELLEWSLAHDPAMALRLAGGLWSYWDISDQIAEGDRWLGRALDACPEGGPPRRRARALSGAGTMAFYLGEFHKALSCHQQALELYRQAVDVPGEVFTLNNVAMSFGELGEEEKCLEMLEACLSQARQASLKKMICFAASNIGMRLSRLGQYARAEALLDEALHAARETNDPLMTAYLLHNIADTKRYQEKLEEAFSLYEASARIGLEGGSELVVAVNTWGKAHVLNRKGEIRTALALHQKALVYFFQIRAMEHIVKAVEGITLALAATGERRMAVCLLAAARAIQADSGQVRLHDPDFKAAEGALEILRAQFSPLEFDLAWQEGWHWSLEQAVQRAMAIEL